MPPFTQVAVELCFEELPNSEMLILPLVRQFVHQPREVARFCGQCARKVRRIANGDRVFRWRQLPLASCSCRLTIGANSACAIAEAPITDSVL